MRDSPYPCFGWCCGPDAVRQHPGYDPLKSMAQLGAIVVTQSRIRGATN